ncbi:MAG: hypothetical protein ACLSGB_08460 [Dorea sp.]
MILILKIIGIIIAVILGILLLLIAIFLFVPVHYEVQGRCDGDLDSLKGKVQSRLAFAACSGGHLVAVMENEVAA